MAIKKQWRGAYASKLRVLLKSEKSFRNTLYAGAEISLKKGKKLSLRETLYKRGMQRIIPKHRGFNLSCNMATKGGKE